MYKKYFSKFLTANQGSLHFAGHSHHYWPDITQEAQDEYWIDSMNLVDAKWGKIFGEKVASTQKYISNMLNIKNSENICFAPNTHELVYRIMSSIEKKGTIKILSTDSEFYSFERQARRLEEAGDIEVTRVSLEPKETFPKRFSKAANQKDYDLIFVSQVFFNNSFAITDLDQFVKGLPDSPLLVIDGYHSFMAIDVDLSNVEDRIFFLGGSYKYAGGGEGCCFMMMPLNCKLRPKYTGWFAEMDQLANKDPNIVSYSSDGMRFAGATMDFTALYRLNSWLNLLEEEKISVKEISSYVKKLQKLFIDSIKETELAQYILSDLSCSGNFLAFSLPSVEKTGEVVKYLQDNGIYTDSRKNVLRFGITMYLSEDDIIKCANIIGKMQGIL